MLEIGVLDLRTWTSSSKEKADVFWKAYEWWTRVEEKDAELNNNQGIVFILDFKGYTLRSMASPEGNQFRKHCQFLARLEWKFPVGAYAAEGGTQFNWKRLQLKRLKLPL